MEYFEAMYQEFRSVVDRLRDQLDTCRRSTSSVEQKVNYCRDLSRTLHSEYDRLGGQYGRMDAVMFPFHTELMDYLDTLTDSEGNPRCQ